MTFIIHELIKPETMEPRQYQIAILSTAEKKNTLACLPTGLGKTNIAILLAAKRLQAYPESKVLLVAPTKPLTHQHETSFKRFMSLPGDEMTVLTGTMPATKRIEQYKDKKIIFATPQTIQNDLEEGRFTLEDFSLLIIDELHHAIGNYAYPYIAKKYSKQATHPRILGLTASPGGTSGKIKEICENTGIEAIEIRTEQDADVSPYIKEKVIDWEYVDLPESFLKIKRILDRFVQAKTLTLRRMGYVHGRGKPTKRELLGAQAFLVKKLKSGNKMVYIGMFTVGQAIKSDHALTLLETQGISILQKYWRKLEKDESKSAKAMVNDKDLSNAIWLTNSLYERGSTHPKISKLCQVVQKQFTEQKDSKVIIFANYRDSVKEIVKALSGIDGIEPVEFTGQKDLRQKEQIERLKDFRAGVYNTLVCTSVGEEGLDIPAMDLAVFYEPVPSEVRSIQRRGRVGRQTVGRVVVLITRGTRDEAYHWTAKNKERKMRGVLYGLSDTPNFKQKTLGKFKASK